mgnify:CR=1 FL=1
METVINEIIDVLKKHGIVNQDGLRNFEVKKRYLELRTVMSCKVARQRIAEEFNIDDKSVQYIIYKSKK